MPAPDYMPDDLPEQPLDDDAYEIAYDTALDDAHEIDGEARDDYIEDESRAWWRHTERAPLWARWWARRHWLLYLAAFLTPLLVVVGLLALLLTLAGDGAGDTVATSIPATSTDTALSAGSSPATGTPVRAPEWPPGVTFAHHTTPARIRNIFTAPGEHHGYAFEGTTGEVWLIAVEPYQASGTDPALTLYGPDGARLCQDAGCAAGQPRSQIAVVLNASGTYRVVVKSASGTRTGLYLLTLDDG